jgi:hypothetical protein
MTTLLLGLLVFSLAFLLLCIGVILGGRPVEGSCGGIKRLVGISSDCGGSCSGESCPRKTATTR